MAQGPGKYDVLATYVREATAADAVVVIVVGGTSGSGFSVQVTEGQFLRLPALLRRIADDIESGDGHA